MTDPRQPDAPEPFALRMTAEAAPAYTAANRGAWVGIATLFGIQGICLLGISLTGGLDLVGLRGFGTVLAPIALAIAMTAVVFGALSTRIASRRSLIDVAGDRITTRQDLQLTRRYALSEIERVVTVGSLALAGRTVPATIVLGQGRRLDLLLGPVWTADQLDRLGVELASRGRVEHVRVTGPTTLSALRRADPSTGSWRDAHPLLTVVIIVVPVVSVVSALIPLLLLHSLR